MPYGESQGTCNPVQPRINTEVNRKYILQIIWPIPRGIYQKFEIMSPIGKIIYKRVVWMAFISCADEAQGSV